jgi:hypothetical protein
VGAALVYPLVWHFSATAPGAPAGAGAPQPTQVPSGARAAPAAALESEASERRVVSRTLTERLPASGATRFAPASAPQPPQLPTAAEPQAPTVAEPQVPPAVMPDVKEVLARVAEVQQHAHNPGELDQQVQTLDEDPAKLARLKAFADMFMKLPTPRGDGYLPSSSGPEGHSPAR